MRTQEVRYERNNKASSKIYETADSAGLYVQLGSRTEQASDACDTITGSPKAF